MRRTNSQTPFTTIGISSLLTVFLVLCLVTFACLSLSTSKNDYDFGENNAQHETEYYSAANEAEEFLNDISNGRTDKTSESFRINDDQALEVQVEITGSNASGGSKYKVTRWQVVSTVERDYNQNVDLIQ